MNAFASTVSDAEQYLERRAAKGDPDARERLDAIEHADAQVLAEADALADLDSFADWLGARLYLRRSPDLGYVPAASAGPLQRDEFGERVGRMSVPALLALALRGDSWAALSMTALRDRYLDDMRRARG